MKDNVIIDKGSSILLSAPHGVTQVRLGRIKFKEPGSLNTALYLCKKVNLSLIPKTKNNYDDANFDEICKYKTDLLNFVAKNNIKYLIDFHGLAKRRECDINLGINCGKNISTNVQAFDNLNNALSKNGFKVSIDFPFMAGPKTIAGTVKNKFPNVWTIQIEINSSITNERGNWAKYIKLLDILQNWLMSLK